MEIKTFVKAALKFVDENLPTILMVAAEIGLAGTVVAAINDAPKAKEAITNKKLDKAAEIENSQENIELYKNSDGEYDLKLIPMTPWEYFTTLAPIYWHTALCAGVTGTCIFMSNHIGRKRYLAVLGALALKEKDLEKYKEKVKEFFGEKKTKELEHEINKDISLNAPVDRNKIYATGHGDYLCYEPLSRSYFRSSIDAVKAGINDFLRQLITDGQATISDLVYALDIPLQDSYVEDRSGWIYEGMRASLPEFSFDYSGNPVTNEPCMVIECGTKPVIGLY